MATAMVSGKFSMVGAVEGIDVLGIPWSSSADEARGDRPSTAKVALFRSTMDVMRTPCARVGHAEWRVVGPFSGLRYPGGMTLLFDQLTENQRECLRLVLTRHSSKEIALAIGISESAVNKRIERAVQQLGASSRFAAARMLAVHEAGGAREGGETCDRLASETIDVPPGVSRSPVRSPDGLMLVHRLLGVLPGEERPGPRNPLGWSARLRVVLALTLLVAMSVVAILSMGQTLSGLVDHGAALRR